MTVFLLVVAVILSLSLSAFCSGAETGFLSVSRERILHLARAGGRKANILQAAISNMARTMTTLLVGNNIANVSFSAASAALSVELLSGTRFGYAVWNLASAIAVLYFSEFMPKLLCSARPLHRLMVLAKPYRALAFVSRPLVAALVFCTDLFVPRKEQKYRVTANDLLRILRDRKDGVCISDIESALISRIIVLRKKGRPITSEELVSAVRDSD